MQNQILMDSGFLYSLLNQKDVNHQLAVAFSQKNRATALMPPIVLTEVCYLVLRDFGYSAVPLFLGNFLKLPIVLEQVTTVDIQNAQAIMLKYVSAKLDFVDCILMAQSERLKITQICTFDRRDFSIFRPSHCPALELLP